MIWKNLIAGLVLLGAVTLWTGCTPPGPLEAKPCPSDEVRPGDTLNISFLDIPDAMPEKEFRVSSDGTINMPLIGSLQVAGKKFGELEGDLQKAYVPRFYTRMTVVIKPGLRWYSVGGEVRLPNRLPYVGEITLLRAITSAGDFTDFANRRKVEVIRASGHREIIDANKARRDPKRYDVPICPGDAIFVPRSL